MNEEVELEGWVCCFPRKTFLDRLGVEDEKCQLVLRNGQVERHVRDRLQIRVHQVKLSDVVVLLADVEGRFRDSANDPVLQVGEELAAVLLNCADLPKVQLQLLHRGQEHQCAISHFSF